MIKPHLMDSIEQEMRSCPQFDGMSVWEHGISVSRRYADLVDHLDWDPKLAYCDWRLPTWFQEPKLVGRLLHRDTLEIYQLYHDIGKPRCLMIDEEGKRHFPNHAEVSKGVWLESSEGTPEDVVIGDLIGMDMLAHTVRGEALIEFAKHPYAPSLLYTALAEIHSNAHHMGRLDSDGFKSKAKQLDKIAKAILKGEINA
jgi:hypothetical protein